MPLYFYKATSSHGTKHSGYRFGSTPDDIYKSLKEEGLLLTDCEESRAERFLPRLSSKFSFKMFHKIPNILLMDFCHHMAHLDEAGVPIHNALKDLALSTPHKGFKNTLHSLYENVQVGIPLSEALARHPKVFDRVFQKLINSGEQTGTFAPQFRHLENHFQQLESMNNQIRKSLRTPIILFGLMMILILVMVDFVIPHMSSLLISLGLKDLPLSTRLLIYVAPILIYFPLILLILGTVVGLGYTFPRTRYYIARFVLNLPLCKPLALRHFWHVFSLMISAGIDLLPSLIQAIQVIENPYLRDQLTSLSAKITAGAGLSETFSQQNAFVSPIMVRFLKLSEQTGRLKELIPHAASHYQNQTFRQIEKMVSWLEPSLILMMGALMLWIVLAIIVPFYGTFGNLT